MKKKLIAVSCGLVLLLSGCGAESATGNVSSVDNLTELQTKENQGKDETKKVETETTQKVIANKEDFDTSVLSGVLLSEGSFENNVAINGSHRDEKKLTISKGKIIFPQGAVRTAAISDDVKKKQLDDMSEDEVRKLIEIIESADIKTMDMEKVENDLYGNGIETNLLYLTSDGKFRTFTIRSVGADWHVMMVRIDNKNEVFMEEKIINKDTNKKIEYVHMYSKELTKLQKKLIEWKEVTSKDFKNIKSITLNTSDGEKVVLSEKETEKLKGIMNTSKERKGAIPETSYYLTCELLNGEVINIGVCGSGQIATEGNLYETDANNGKKMLEVLRVYN